MSFNIDHGVAHAKLAGAFFYGDEHNVANPHNAAKQCKDAHNPQGGAYNGRARVHLQAAGKPVRYPNGLFIVGRGVVASVNLAAITLLEGLISSLCV